MRVIAGSRKGHKLAAPRGLDTRPTSDRVRENIFNLVGPVDDTKVLDLFASSGALGIEALSRGAASATFVERDRRTAAVIRRNLEDVGAGDRANVVVSDAVIRPHWQRHLARDVLGVEPLELDAGHSPMLERPSELAAMLDALA